MQGIDILGVKVDGVDQRGLQKMILAEARAFQRRIFAYVNVHALNLAHSNQEFHRFLNDADVVYCDGEGIRLAARVLGSHLPPRVVLTHFVWDLCAACEREGLSVYVLGSQAPTLKAAIEAMRIRHPALQIVGWHHGYFVKSGSPSEQVIELINTAQPNLLFVGFGMPLQERWLSENVSRLQVGAILPCGSMIDYASGEKSVAPAWMADNGMEWAYRLLQEPRRLWKRYLIGIPWFFCRVVKQRFFGSV
jgi:N-acetylglucosaminyldiphosphoundecaprenol N-acetyl-beta-D-mannosaminyltransferase